MMAAKNVIIAFLPLFLIFHRFLLTSAMPLVLKNPASQECSFSALLLEGREEDEDCNLLLLLRQRINSRKIQIDEGMHGHTRRLALDAFNRPNRKVNDIETCPATDSICKLESNRLCICPPQHVCDQVDDTDVYRCEMLAFFHVG